MAPEGERISGAGFIRQKVGQWEWMRMGWWSEGESSVQSERGMGC
jgi:hypothetical protein